MVPKFPGILSLAVLTGIALGAGSAKATDRVTSAQFINAYGGSAHTTIESAHGVRSIMSAFDRKVGKTAAAPFRGPAPVTTGNIKAEVIVDENFANWTKGSASEPYAEMVTDEEASSLMNYPGEWTLFRMYQAGGNGYMGFDEIGDEGPGYIMSPEIDVMNGDEGYYRFTCHVKNVNADAQDQNLQAFFMDGEASSIISADTRPMKYNEWTSCEWIGEGCAATKFMVLGWKGKILINGYKVEKITFPLSTPKGISAEYTKEGKIILSWNKVEGATSYSVALGSWMDIIYNTEVGDVNSCEIDVSVTEGQNYSFYVMARNGEDSSYWGYCSGDDLIPGTIGNAVAKEATEVSANGFTANWDKADYANEYLVLPVVTHTATAPGDEFFILNELFTNVPEDADDNNPIQIAPTLGYTGTDIYMSRAGWQIDMGIFLRLLPEMPGLALTDQYKDYGLEGSLISPATDYSVGNGTVRISGMGLSALDDVVMTAGYLNADNEMYSCVDFEVSTSGEEFDVELTGGKADSRLVIKITDSAEGGDMVIISCLNISTVLNEGETITVPAETIHVDKNTDNARVDVTIGESDRYFYMVQGYFSPLLMGGVSNMIEVGEPAAVGYVNKETAGSAFLVNGIIHIQNPEALNCSVYTLDGKQLFSTSETSASMSVEKGAYIIQIGEKSIKLAN